MIEHALKFINLQCHGKKHILFFFCLHDRACIWVVITEHGDVRVFISCDDSSVSRGLHSPHITGRSLLVIRRNCIWMSHQVVRHIGPNLSLLPCWFRLLQHLVWFNIPSYCNFLLFSVPPIDHHLMVIKLNKANNINLFIKTILLSWRTLSINPCKSLSPIKRIHMLLSRTLRCNLDKLLRMWRNLKVEHSRPLHKLTQMSIVIWSLQGGVNW